MSIPPERIAYTTEDNVTIVGDWHAVDKDVGERPWALLLLHMMPADRKSWERFAARFASDGFQSLAIDLRGHGESVKQGGAVLDYHAFTDEDHKNSIRDVHTGIGWLAQQDVPPSQIILIGASIGANLALQQLVEQPSIPAACVLSPGLDYRGVQTEQSVQQLKQEQNVLFVASNEDERSRIAVEKLDRICSCPHKSVLLNGAGHGTMMLERDEALVQTIQEWTRKIRDSHNTRQ